MFVDHSKVTLLYSIYTRRMTFKAETLKMHMIQIKYLWLGANYFFSENSYILILTKVFWEDSTSDLIL